MTDSTYVIGISQLVHLALTEFPDPMLNLPCLHPTSSHHPVLAIPLASISNASSCSLRKKSHSSFQSIEAATREYEVVDPRTPCRVSQPDGTETRLSTPDPQCHSADVVVAKSRAQRYHPTFCCCG